MASFDQIIGLIKELVDHKLALKTPLADQGIGRPTFAAETSINEWRLESDLANAEIARLQEENDRLRRSDSDKALENIVKSLSISKVLFSATPKSSISSSQTIANSIGLASEEEELEEFDDVYDVDPAKKNDKKKVAIDEDCH
uniref:Uncharacterized protein n=1 Tax=Ditylenchus dipsaci TaxID=166011 RepID=A0A915EC76_9BILA